MQGSQGIQGLHGSSGSDGLAGVDGSQGKQGHTGETGEQGSEGRGIASLKLGAKWIQVTYTDGTTETIPMIGPTGAQDDPKLIMESDPSRVRDLTAGDNITIDVDRFGNYTINSTAISEEFMTDAQAANLALVATNTSKLINNQDQQFEELRLEMNHIKRHLQEMTDETFIDNTILEIQ